MDARKNVVVKEYSKRAGFLSRARAAVTGKPGTTFEEIKKERATEIKKTLKDAKIQYAQEFLDSLICK